MRWAGTLDACRPPRHRARGDGSGVRAMGRGARKQPIWSTIPVPGFCVTRRDPNRQQQALLQKRREEEEELKRRRKEQEEAARILARRWSEEDKSRRAEAESSTAGRKEVADDAGAVRRVGGVRGGASECHRPEVRSGA